MRSLQIRHLLSFHIRVLSISKGAPNWEELCPLKVNRKLTVKRLSVCSSVPNYHINTRLLCSVWSEGYESLKLQLEVGGFKTEWDKALNNLFWNQCCADRPRWSPEVLSNFKDSMVLLYNHVNIYIFLLINCLCNNLFLKLIQVKKYYNEKFILADLINWIRHLLLFAINKEIHS